MWNSKFAWGLLAALCATFGWGLIRLYDLRLTAGDIYPVYSSFRADPLGAKVLYESLLRMHGYTVERNYQPLDNLHQRSGTMLWLGENPFAFPLRSEEDLKQFEAIASRGIRLVIAMAPVKRPDSAAQMQVKNSPLEKRWNIAFVYVQRIAPQSETTESPLPRHTALVMKLAGNPAPIVDMPFGKGSIVLVDSAYPLSNEALATDRDTAWLDRLLGPHHTIIFDEHHLGLSENVSIAMLARKYRLTGLLAGLLILAALFIWRNSSTLLPPKRPSTDDETRLARGRDSASALQHLLHRNIPPSDLIRICLAEWEKSGRDGRFYSAEKIEILHRLAAPKGNRDPVEIYRKMQSIINQKQ